MKSVFNALVFIILFVHTNSFAKNLQELLNELKSANQELENYVSQAREKQLTSDRTIDEIKFDLETIKKELKQQKTSLGEKSYSITGRSLNENFELLDFHLYDWNEDTYRVIARIWCKSKLYSDFIKLRYNFYSSGELVGTDFSYIDHASHGSAGMLPYHTSFLESFTDKAEFDSVSFEISRSYYESEDTLWDQLLVLESNQILKDGSLNHWIGQVKNNFNYSVTFPKIFACFYKNDNLIDLDYTYLDVEENTLQANQTGTYDSYIDLPEDYDEIKYVIGYSLYSLTGSGNITPNWPVFTERSYTGQARMSIPFEAFLIDYESDLMTTQVDWGDGTPPEWSNQVYSGYNASLTHGYAEAGTYLIRAKSSDGTESSWSEEYQITISATSRPSILSTSLKTAKYKNPYRDTLKVTGGFPPYHFEIISGNLPGNISLDESSGIFSGTPNASGKFDFSVRVFDSGNPVAADTANLFFEVLNSAPQITSADSLAVAEFSLLNYTARVTDAENNPVQFTFKNLPHWLASSDSTIFGTPPETASDTSFKVIAFDGELQDSLLVKVTVIEINALPEIQNLADFSFINDQTYSINLDSCVIDADHQPEEIQWQITPKDANLKISLENHRITFSAPNWAGATEVEFIATDPAGGTDSLVVKVKIDYPVSVPEFAREKPTVFSLSQNYPNPFNPTTRIYFGLPKPANIEIVVYNLLGKQVAQLFKGNKEIGYHWIKWDAAGQPSGVYLIQLKSEKNIFVKRCVLIK